MIHPTSGQQAGQVSRRPRHRRDSPFTPPLHNTLAIAPSQAPDGSKMFGV